MVRANDTAKALVRRMLSYVIRRLLLLIPTLLGITLVVFTTMALAPGGITAQSLVDDVGLNPQEKAALESYYNKRYGLDQPAPVQYLRWLNNVSPVGFKQDEQGTFEDFNWWKGSDLGESFRYGRPVQDIIGERIPITLLLNALTIPLIYVISIMIGLRAAVDRGGRFDVASSAVMLALWSIPTMLTGVLLIGFFASDAHWHWFPTTGLSEREAIDMPFMPHWPDVWSILRFSIGLLGGTILAVALALMHSKNIRCYAAILLSLILSLFAVNSLPYQPHIVVYISVFLIMLIVYWAALSGDYLSLRVVVLALTGLVVGGMLGAMWAGDGFVRGFLLDRIWHLILPVICLAYGSFAFLARLTRSSVLENLQADFARTARAKGVPEDRVLWHHVFRNSLIPLVTVLASLLPGLLGGSVIVESIFSIDGMGKLAVDAVKGRDRELVLAITLMGGVLTLLGNLLADLLYAVVDPRVNYE